MNQLSEPSSNTAPQPGPLPKATPADKDYVDRAKAMTADLGIVLSDEDARLIIGTHPDLTRSSDGHGFISTSRPADVRRKKLVIQIHEARARLRSADQGRSQPETRTNHQASAQQSTSRSDTAPQSSTPSKPPRTVTYATAADLIREQGATRWSWKGWSQTGVLTLLAAEPGIGKTRFCADISRRIYHGLAWPDGSLPSFPPGSKTLWVISDNHHAEIAALVQEFGIPPEACIINAQQDNVYGGTTLDSDQELREFEGRIKLAEPALVFIDTVGNATDRETQRPEQAKAFYLPLQQIAQRTNTSLWCLTHLNAGGAPSGRRVEEKCRTVIMLEHPDKSQADRRRLHVKKTNAKRPQPLGVTMGNQGNEYDTNPPCKPGEGGSDDGGIPTKIQACMSWLQDLLKSDPKRVSHTRNEAELAGFDAKTLYKAKDRLGVEQFEEADSKKWWKLPSPPPSDD